MALTAAFKARRRNPNAASHAANNANKEAGANLQWLFGAISLNFLLGITWIYGFFIFADDGTVVIFYSNKNIYLTSYLYSSCILGYGLHFHHFEFAARPRYFHDSGCTE